MKRIVVASAAIGTEFGRKAWVQRAKTNHKNYCQHHGFAYELREIPQTDRTPHWEKIHLVLQLFDEGFEFVFWMDIDSIFMNFDISIEELLPENGRDFVFSGDTNIINSGHFIFRNTQWSRDALNTLWDIGPINVGMGRGDNACFSIWLAGGLPTDSLERKVEHYHRVDQGYRDRKVQKRIESGRIPELLSSELRTNVQMIKKSLFNSYLRDFQSGHFILHLVNDSDRVRNFYTAHLLLDSGKPAPINLFHMIRLKMFLKIFA